MGRAAAWGALGALVLVVGACGSGGTSGQADAALVPAPDGAVDGGVAIAEPDAGETPDAAVEPPDAAVGSPDAAVGPPDAAVAGPDASIVQPTSEGWTFYGTGNGGPSRITGATMDEGGNLWVAGGEQGLYLMKAGSTRFQQFGISDGLHPWGEPYPGSEQTPVTRTYLNVLSVSGGPAGTVFVGYEGLDEGWGCEDEWDRSDGVTPDPSVYKSGDADRVTLSGSGIQVTHYDISSPPGFVGNEPRGREKICKVYRILYDARSRSVWFGGNHAYAWGDPNSSKVWEHAHPVLNGFKTSTSTKEAALTGRYYGLAVEPTGDLWVGGIHRSQHCLAGMGGSGFFDCESQGTLPDGRYAIDWWPDLAHVDSWPFQREGRDDEVSGMALGLDGSLWIGSFERGLAHRKTDGTVEFFTTGLIDPQRVSSVAVDPEDGSVWVGATKGGLTRIQAGVFTVWDSGVLGGRASSEVSDIQIDRSGARRRIVVSFRSGSVGVYGGP